MSREFGVYVNILMLFTSRVQYGGGSYARTAPLGTVGAARDAAAADTFATSARETKLIAASNTFQAHTVSQIPVLGNGSQ